MTKIKTEYIKHCKSQNECIHCKYFAYDGKEKCKERFYVEYRIKRKGAK